MHIYFSNENSRRPNLLQNHIIFHAAVETIAWYEDSFPPLNPLLCFDSLCRLLFVLVQVLVVQCQPERSLGDNYGRVRRA